MNIYIIPAWYYDNTCHVTTCFFREQAHALANQGHNVTVITIKLISVKKIFKKKLHDERFWQDGNVRTFYHQIIIPVPSKINKIHEWYIKILYYKIINKQIQNDIKSNLPPPDLIHSHISHSCAYYCLYTAKKMNLPIVVTEHFSGLLTKNVSIRELERVKETIIKSNAFIFVGSNFQKEVCRRLKISKTTYVIPNMLDVSRFNIEIPKQTNQFTFLTACSLKPNKSVDKVIIAFHNAFKDEKNVKLIISGYGIEFEKLKKLAIDLEEQSRITFTGKYSREETSSIFSQADVFVLTSQIETFGIVYIEAMMFGIPCIGTKGQGAEDIIDNTNGIKVQYGNIQQLIEAMKSIKNNYNQYSKETIRKNCINKFSNDHVCTEIQKIYNSVLNNIMK